MDGPNRAELADATDGFLSHKRFLLHDRDPLFTPEFEAILAASGVKGVPLPGLERLSEVRWLRQPALHYWGDIDTYGFHILDRLRSTFPNAWSFLMDRETLLEHVPL
ncbi:MAG: conserved hypothetical cytosolic protein, partial [Bryobacterales bacterium]|nr:conserved hypothetical cytosolic protein [Bryobacterales bacterium]